MIPIRLTPAARREAEEAAQWYDEQDPGRGDHFWQHLSGRLQRIQRVPGAGTKLLEATEQRGPVRAYRLSRTYPYVVVAFEHAEQLVVVAIHHERREPMYWRRRAK